MTVSLKHRIGSVLLLLTMIGTLLMSVFMMAIPVAAAEELTTISHTSPAIRADVGQTIDLSKYRLQVAATTIIEPDKLTWSSTEIALNGNRVTPSAKGVYVLSVTNGSITRKVYLVVKEKNETEYVLYENDFSDASSIGDWKTIQQSSGASFSVKDGKLVMDASNSTSSYIRLMLPAFLNDFGDYRFEATGTITKVQNEKRYLALMFRIQANNYPYYQMCVRQNAALSNGTEFAERTPSDAWNVTHTAPYSSKLSATGNYTFAVDVNGSAVATSINGERLIYTATATKYSKGAPGLQVNGCSASFTSVKVTLNDAVEATPTDLAQTREPASNLAQTPSMVSHVETAEDLRDILTSSPSAAVMRVNSALDVTDAKGTKIATVEEAMAQLNQQVIPAFYVEDDVAVKKLCAYLKQEEIVDAFVMSADPALVRLARDTYGIIRGIVDFSVAAGVETMAMSAIRAETNAAGARIAVIPASLATQANVEALQRLFITVWVQSESDTTVELVSHITSGANGILTQDRAELERCFTAYFSSNAVTRVVNVIGHRGQPSTGQENSIASSIEAYEAGATMIENDIYLSKDGVIVVMHDSTIDRTTNGVGAVESMTVAELQKYMIDGNTSKATQPIPTLEDYFKEFKGKDVQLIVEIKSSKEAILKPLAELIEKYDILDQVNVITFKYDQILKLKKEIPGISVGYLTGDILLSEDEALLTMEKVLDVVQAHDTTFNPSYANGALGPKVMSAAWVRGVTLWPYTINNQADFDTYFLYGTNGITTNYSYWVSEYIKNVSVAQDSYEVLLNETTEIPVLRTNYNREQKASTAGSMIVIAGNAAAISYKQGKLTATEAGEYTVLFRHACNLANGKVYSMYSQPVTIRVIDESASTEAVTTAPTAQEPDSSADNASPVVSVAFSQFIIPVAVVVVALIGVSVVVAAVRLKKK